MENCNYLNLKTQKLLEFCINKVIWIFSDSQQVMIAECNADAGLTINWHRDPELLDGQTFTIGAYLIQEGIDPNQE